MHREKNYICAECGKAYVNDKDLKRHQKYECGRNPRFRCPYCQTRAKYRSIIYVHIRSLHPYMEVRVIDLEQFK